MIKMAIPLHEFSDSLEIEQKHLQAWLMERGETKNIATFAKEKKTDDEECFLFTGHIHTLELMLREAFGLPKNRIDSILKQQQYKRR